MSDLDTPDPEEQGLVFLENGVVAGFKNAVITPLTEEDVAQALARTEIIEAEGVDLLASPGQVYLVEKYSEQVYLVEKDSDPIVTRWGGEVSWEVELPEEDFWRLVEAVLGQEAVQEMRQDLEDLLRWESEGGPCLS